MDVLTFISTVVASLAWPVALLVALLVLRRELKDLFRVIRRLRAGPVEAEFEREVRELKQEVEVQPELQALPAAAGNLPLMGLAASHPRAAILEAWRELEGLMLRVAPQMAVVASNPRIPNTSAIIRNLVKSGRLTNEAQSLLQDLRALRNRAAHDHDFQPTYEAAANYVEMAARLSARITAAGL